MKFRITSFKFPNIFAQGEFDKDWYYKWIISGVSIIVGIFLILEHWLTWGGFDLEWGHEWLGLLFVIFGMFIGGKKNESC